jgi:DUF2934 family protein
MLVSDKSKRNKYKFVSSQSGMLNELKEFHPLPSHEQISQRAYEIYQSTGYLDGRDQQDWFRAEQELFAPRK